MSLIHRELREAVEASIVVALHNNPCWGITNPEVDDFARHDKLMQTVHQLRDAGREVPPMEVEEVDVVSLQLFQAGLD